MSRLRQEISASTIGAIGADADGFYRVYRFAENFVGFQGHFPGHPVLPAFVQILAAQVAVEDRKGEPLVMQQVKRAKFTKIIHPGEDVGIVWNEKENGDRLICRVTVTVSRENAAVFTLYFKRD